MKKKLKTFEKIKALGEFLVIDAHVQYLCFQFILNVLLHLQLTVCAVDAVFVGTNTGEL